MPSGSEVLEEKIVRQAPAAPPKKANVHRIEEIDSLRGLAALCVVGAHVEALWGAPHSALYNTLRATPLSLLLAADRAVFLFFVMSGFVLFLPYLRPQGADPYKAYLIKRVCRIYVPYFVALVLSAIAYRLWARVVPGVVPYNGGWRGPFDWRLLWKHVLFVGVYPSDRFNISFWSLVQEMRISIIFPAVAFVAMRLRLAWGSLVGLALVALGITMANHSSFWIWRTLGFTGMFLMGASIARHLAAIRSHFNTKGRYLRPVCFVLCALTLLSGHLLPSSARHPFVTTPTAAISVALVLVLAIMSKSFRALLHTRPARWLGRVSYSLYLVHALVLFSMICLFWDRMNHALLLYTAVALSLVLAELMFRWVELPAIALGRKLSGRRSPKMKPL